MKMFKKMLASLMVAVMVLTAAPLSGFVGMELNLDWLSFDWLDFNTKASAATYSGTCGDNLTWSLNTSTGELVISGEGEMDDYSYSSAPWYSYRSSIKKATIGNGVTSIGSCAFYNFTGLTSIAIPDSVTSIGEEAFGYCDSLTSITIPDSVTSIGDDAFYDCDRLTSATIGNSVTSIGDDAFHSCDRLTSVTIGNSVTSIGSGAFYGCTSLTSITIPDSVTCIGNYAFSGCTSLTSITIPDSVTSIGYSAFYNCSGLTELTMPISAKIYNSFYTFGNCTNIEKITLTKGNGTVQNYYSSSGYSNTCYVYTPWYISRNSLKEIVIEDGVTGIGSYTFCGCTGLTSITIPDSVTSIGKDAFYNCTSLTSITIPDSLTSISPSTFQGCTGLTSITIPDSVTSIGAYAFYDCTSLTSVTIPDSVTSICGGAFLSCASLTSITIPDSVTIIGSDAFSGCTSLTSITIPDSVTSIGSDAFFNCTSLTSITVDENNNTYSSDEYGVLFNKDKTELIQYPIGNERTSYTIPDSVTSIGYEAFRECTSLTRITIPDSVTSIGFYAFSGCTDLTSVTIGNGVTSISSSAFEDCGSLTSITIPDSVTSIGSYAFWCCDSLTSITIPDSVTSIGDSAFSVCSSLTDVYYIGTQTQWNGISLGSDNDSLTKADIHFCEKREGVSATCEDDGYTEGVYCSVCDKYVLGHEEILALGHDYQVEETPVTCTTAGKKVYTCYCGDTYTEEFPALGHNPEYFKVDPTCKEAGYECYKCTNCGTEYMREELDIIDHISGDWEIVESANCSEDDYKIRKCTMCGEETHRETIPASGHRYEESIVTEPTCEGVGVKRFTCSVCGDSYDEMIAANGHTGEYHRVESTCKVKGYEYYKCTVCNIKYQRVELDLAEHISGEWETVNFATCTSDGVKVKKCTQCGDELLREVIPATGHGYESIIVSEPTCVKQGTKRYTCSCGDSYDETIPATGEHKINIIRKDPTCTSIGNEQYLCETCGNMIGDMVFLPKLPHTYDEWTVVKDPTATEEGTKEHSCTVCGKTETVAIPAIGFETADGVTVDLEKNIISGFNAGVSSLDSYTTTVNDNYIWEYETSNGKLGTGSKAILKDGDTVIGEYTILVYGDTTGDSWYDGQDAIIVDCLANGMLTQEDVGEAVYTAADCNHDGVIDQLDVALLNQAGTLLANVDQSKPAEVLLETSSAYVEYISLIDQSFEIETEDGTDADTEDLTQQGSAELDLFEMIISFIKSIIEMILSHIPVPYK